MRLLLTGAGGFLAWHICGRIKPTVYLHGWYHQQAAHTPTCSRVDIGNPQAVEEDFIHYQPDAILHTAAISRIERVEENPALAEQINVEAPVLLARLCREKNIPFVFCSSDMVFNGKETAYTETDNTHPLNEYGNQKARAERLIMKSYPQSTIARLPLLLGMAPGSGAGLIPDMVQKNKEGASIELFTDEYRSTAWARDVADGLLLLLQQKKQGIWHLGGKEAMSRYELGLDIKKAFELEQLQIKPVTHAQKNVEKRPARAELNSKKTYAIGYDPLPVKKALELIRLGH
jgi:dTDP-4-dehydrorhamnose reductase